MGLHAAKIGGLRRPAHERRWRWRFLEAHCGAGRDMEPGVCLRVDGGAALHVSGEAVEAVEGLDFWVCFAVPFACGFCVFSVPKEERQ